jgi:hypothetical protein
VIRRAIKAGAEGEGFLLDTFHVELLGCVVGLQEAARMGIAHLHIETDATLVKAALESDEHGLSAVRGIITEMKLLLATEHLE